MVKFQAILAMLFSAAVYAQEWSYLGIPYVTDNVPEEIMPILPDGTNTQAGWPYDPCSIATPTFSNGSNQYYVDTVNGNDGTAGNSGRGSIAAPRQTVPGVVGDQWTFTEGMQVFVTANSTIAPGGDRDLIFNGTSSNPCWLIGVGGQPIYSGSFIAMHGTHMVIDNIRFENGGGGMLMRIGYNNESKTVSHLCIRSCTFKGNGVYSATNGAGLYGESASFVVIYQCDMSGNGQWDYPGETNFDRHAIQPTLTTRYWWIIDNDIYHMQGDSVQVNTSGHLNGVYSERPHYIYIAGNRFHSNYENAVDNKNGFHIIVSENEFYNFYNSYKPANQTAVILANDAEGWLSGYEWLIANRIHDSGQAVKIAATAASEMNEALDEQVKGQKCFAVGNLIWDVTDGIELDSNGTVPTGSTFYTYADEVWVVDNTIDATDQGIYQSRLTGDGFVVLYQAEGNIIYSRGTQWDLDFDNDGDLTVRNVFRNVVYQTDGSVTIPTWKIQGYSGNVVDQNPLFTDLAANDYSLQSGSPAIGVNAESAVYDRFQGIYGISIQKDASGTVRPASTWDSGALEFGSSMPSGTPIAPSNIATPTITGTATEDQTLTTTGGSWSGSPAPTLTYQWIRCDAAGDNPEDIVGATSASYTIVTADVGSTIRVRVTGTNTEDSASATSSQTAVVSAAPSEPSTATSGTATNIIIGN